jgi:hypothetical protein
MAVERKMKKMLKEAIETDRGFSDDHYHTRRLACFPSNSTFDVQYMRGRRVDHTDEDQKHEEEVDVYQLHSQGVEWCFVDRFDVDGRRMEGVSELSKQKLYISGSGLLAEEDKHVMESTYELQQRLPELKIVLNLPETVNRAEPVAEEGGNTNLPPVLEKPPSVDIPALPVGFVNALPSLPDSGIPVTAVGGTSFFTFAAVLPSRAAGALASPVFQGAAFPGMLLWFEWDSGCQCASFVVQIARVLWAHIKTP